jgi:glucose/arabinose dehydrogenase
MLNKRRCIVFVFCCLIGCGIKPQGPENGNGDGGKETSDIQDVSRKNFQIRTLVGGLDTPWDLAFDPSGRLWITEREGTVTVVDTTTGLAQQVGVISGVLERGESGLMGMAFHPNFPSTPQVYFAHSYNGGGGNVKNRLVRLAFDGFQLHSQETLLKDIPGSFNHNGSRLVIGPDRLLYMSTGDAEGPNRAIDLSSLAGKILRLDLDGKAAPNNPFATEVYSFGHRNPQGLAFEPTTNRLYATEHGPSTNDELNLILGSRNHGWPEVHGFCSDEDVVGLAEAQYCRENNVNEPLFAWTPTIAPSGASFYDSDVIPNWRGSLLFTTLKNQALHRLTLGSDGTKVIGQEVLFREEFGRLRDVVVGGRGEIYLATSNQDGRGNISGADRIILVTYRP